MKYYRINDIESAVKVLELSPDQTIVNLWKAFLTDDNNTISSIVSDPVDMVFPHRIETAEILEELIAEEDSWILKYYLGLIYWNKGLTEKAKRLFEECGDSPDRSWFWLSKAELFSENKKLMAESFERAYKLNPGDWRSTVGFSEYLISEGNPGKASMLCHTILPDYPENTKLGLTYARALFEEGKYSDCLDFLNEFQILPYEGSVDGKKIYSEACNRLALDAISKKKYRQAVRYAEKSKEWPSNLGVGRPYDVDERLEDFIIAYATEQYSGKRDFSGISDYRIPFKSRESSRLIFQLIALKEVGKESEAKAHIERLLSDDPENIYLHWAKARIESVAAAEEIQNIIIKGGTEQRAYDTRFIDRDFSFVLRVLKTLGY